MSEEEVVVLEPNPTNEDLSIDNAIEALYVSEEVTESAPEETKVEADVSESKEVAESTESEEGADESEEGEFSLPENMPKELQESLASLDEEVQKRSVEVFKKMQGSFTKKNQEFAEQKKLAENINTAFENSGLNVGGASNQERVVGNYIAFEKLIASDPTTAVKKLMEHAKVKLEDLGSTPTKSSDDEYLTDEEVNNRKNNETLQQRIDQLEQNAAYSKSQAQQSVVDGFRNKTNEAGDLVNPHFDVVKDDMMDLADVNKTLTISQLYSKAVRNNDDLYKQDMEAEIERRVGAKESKRKAEVENAKKMNGQSLKVGAVNTNVVEGYAMFEQLARAAGWN